MYRTTLKTCKSIDNYLFPSHILPPAYNIVYFFNITMNNLFEVKVGNYFTNINVINTNISL
jgi:hypothetical protein